ncbi:MAG TPA: recombinase family protein [Phycisphaerae bacterium]|nr:recombinase family protein [Phycisphaerae bacterium]
MQQSILDKLKHYAGQRYVILARCSDADQKDSSTPEQIRDIHAHCAAAGLIAAGRDVILNGVTGSHPGKRDDLKMLFKRKQEDNDYTLLISLIEDRFTRGGAGHGHWAEYEFLRHGVTVVHLRSDIPEGPHATLLRTLKFESARDFASTTSMRTIGGVVKAQAEGRALVQSHTPWGLDRLYTTPDGTKLCIVRKMLDGTQQLLDPVTRELRRVLGEPNNGAIGHYRKQKKDLVFLVPGVEHVREVIILMMEMRWLQGIGGHRIAALLNALDIPAPEGGPWTQRQVEVITENLVYTGDSLGNQAASGVFNRRTKDGAVKRNVDPIELATKRYLKPEYCLPEDWVEQDDPYLKHFLPEPVRTVAASKIRELKERRARGQTKKLVRNTKLTSEYLLTSLIRDPDGIYLKGRNCGPRGKQVRYYGHPKAAEDSQLYGPNTTFRAEVLEKAILEALSETLRAMPEFEEEVRLAVDVACNQRKPVDPHSITELKRQLDKTQSDIKLVYELITPETKQEGKARLGELGQKQRELQKQLAEAQALAEEPALDKERLVQSIIERMMNLAGELGKLPTFALRQVLGSITDSMVANRHTREVTMTLKLPPQVFVGKDNKNVSDLCLETSSGSRIGSQAQNELVIALAKIKCNYTRVRGKPCYECRRIKKAA